MDSGYDELLNENPFFEALCSKEKSMFETAASNRWMICIPRKGSTGRSSHNIEQFANHILKPLNDGKYATANGKEVQINGSFIVTSKGFSQVQSVKILFEETYFNPREESYHVLCIDRPLEGGSILPLEAAVPNLETLQNCIDFLWSGTSSRRVRREIDEILSLFNSSYQKLEAQSIRHTMDAANAVFTRALQRVLKEAHLGRPAKGSKSFHDNVKIAVETYVMHGLHKRIFSGISSFLANKDAALNKVTRNLADLQVRDLGVRMELCKNIPKAKRILSKLNEFTTPLEKLYVLKLTINAISESMSFEGPEDGSSAVTADDLLVVLVFLVVKSEIPNWLANLTYMHNFHFSKCKSDEFQFYLASAEAAVEYVRSGKLDNVILANRATGQTIRSGFSEKLITGERTSSVSMLDKLYQFVIDDNKEKVAKILANSAVPGRKGLVEKLCHPLCSCDKCEKIVQSKRSDPSAVTVFSRDDTGATVLHVAAEFGREDIVHTLIKHEAVVNATNYHGDTPLHFACSRGHKSVVVILIHYGADPNSADNDGNSPLHMGVANGHEDVTEALIYASPVGVTRINLNMTNEHGDTPLHIAARWGFSGIVKVLIENGAAVGLKNNLKQTPRHCALNSKVQDLLDAACENDKSVSMIPPKQEMVNPSYLEEDTTFSSDFSRRGSEEFERLIKAVVDGDYEMVRFKLGMLVENSEKNETDPALSIQELLCHPLCQCESCRGLNKTSAKETLALNANMTTKDGASPLHFAALYGFDRIVNLLLNKAGANPNVKTFASQRTPLHLACQYNHVGCTSSLLKHGAKVNARDCSGNTALHFSCSNGHLAPAILLLQSKANPNARNKRGNTPLHDASRWSHIDLCNVLLSYGASKDERNKSQLTPLQCAKSDDIVEFLSHPNLVDDTDGQTPAVLTGAYKSDREHQDQLFDYQVDRTGANVFSYSSPTSEWMEKKSAYSSTASEYSFSGLDEKVRHSTSTSSEEDIFSTPLLSYGEDKSQAGGNEPERNRKTTVHHLFAAFEADDVKKLRQIARSICTFDRRKSLRKVDTVDKSAPYVDDHLKQLLSIRNFDKRSLRHVMPAESVVES